MRKCLEVPEYRADNKPETTSVAGLALYLEEYSGKWWSLGSLARMKKGGGSWTDLERVVHVVA